MPLFHVEVISEPDKEQPSFSLKKSSCEICDSLQVATDGKVSDIESESHLKTEVQMQAGYSQPIYHSD